MNQREKEQLERRRRAIEQITLDLHVASELMKRAAHYRLDAERHARKHFSEEFVDLWAIADFSLCLGWRLDPDCTGLATHSTDGDDTEYLCEHCFTDMVKCAEMEAEQVAAMRAAKREERNAD